MGIKGKDEERGDSRQKWGQSLTEMALVLPIFLVLIFAILEFGLMLFKNISVTNGTREGVRRAAMNTYTRDQIKGFVQQNAWAANIAANDIKISTLNRDPAFPNSPPTVSIQTTASHKWFLMGILLDDLPLRSSQRSVVVTYPGKENITF